MNYLLIEKKQLDEKGLFPYAEQLPDGRCIIPMSALKAATGFKNIEIVDDDTLDELMNPQNNSQEPSNTNKHAESK